MDQDPKSTIELPHNEEEQRLMAENMKEKFAGADPPDKLDATTKNLGMPASLLNFYFATQADLSSIGLGKAVHIPVQVSEREGGRKSIYYLDQNEEILAGIYVTSEGLALRFVRRVTGSSLPAQAGDVYSTRITNRAGELVFEGQETLQAFDPQTGEGWSYGPLPAGHRSWWWFGSLAYYP